MDKLIITSTVDSSVSYPSNPHMPAHDDTKTIAREYIEAVNAGSSLTHLHGVRYLDDEIKPDGRKSVRIDFEGWRDLTERIRAEASPIVQYGISVARLEDKKRLMDFGPEMMSYAFAAQDMCFHHDPKYAANEMYALHPRTELVEFAEAAIERSVKPELECFHTGAFWNLEYVRSRGLLKDPVWVTLLIGWPGGTWTPPTQQALLYMVQHLPPRTNWNLSVMSPKEQWQLIPLAISLGGHVRIGWEDNPYLPNGEPAKHNAELVEHVVRIAESMGREIASPEEAARIIGL